MANLVVPSVINDIILRCGNVGCTVTTTLRKCTVCKIEFYCGVACQKADWSIHRLSCKILSPEEYNLNIIHAYFSKHREIYRILGLTSIGFYRNYHHLPENERATFSSANEKFVHVLLRKVDSPPGQGLHNEVAYIGAGLQRIDTLRSPEALLQQLSDAFPSILLGFTIYDPLYDEIPPVTVFMCSFDWPSADERAMRPAEIVCLIGEAERALQQA
ncbi:hypothetical protein HYPSUDRAFT_58269 [Hypholoma sublateritium FD-334 SS-4]|uniref:MYND-type domain-containing protein n=1 Tax=Hypholoma sublateritium (strain FD-334 SS-4) TaxID=945553 RepID=A0A0D2LZJ0_HYPSF|nr:hypothetical protein HYPSUDRAFT_58269 [Hypholoma sublateritium FD-334 SS-4]